MDSESITIILCLWSLLITVFMSGLSWLVNRIFKMIDDLRKEDEIIKNEINNKYVRRDDYMNFQNQIIDFLRRIEDKIDKKQDK
jgi:hypothetical protein